MAGEITQAQITEVFDKLSESEFWLPNRVISNDSFAVLGIIAFIMLFGLVLFFFGIYMKALELRHVILYPFMTFPFILFAICFIKMYEGSHGSGLEYLGSRQDSFNHILRTLNKETFLKKGYRWEAGENGAWIELQLTKVKKELGDYHRKLETEIGDEINEELCNEMYIAGINPIRFNSWGEFN